MISHKLKSIQSRILALKGEEYKTIKEDMNYLLHYIIHLHRELGTFDKGRTIKPTKHDKGLALEWFQWAKEKMPWLKVNLDQWSVEIAKIKAAKDIRDSGFDLIFRFIKDHKFWSKNCLSPASLLKESKGDGIAKIDYIIRDIKEAHEKTGVTTADAVKNDNWDNPFK